MLPIPDSSGYCGGSGSITLNVAEQGHVAGSFAFTLAAQPGTTPASRQVTSGRFDVKY